MTNRRAFMKVLVGGIAGLSVPLALAEAPVAQECWIGGCELRTATDDLIRRSRFTGGRIKLIPGDALHVKIRFDLSWGNEACVARYRESYRALRDRYNLR